MADSVVWLVGLSLPLQRAIESRLRESGQALRSVVSRDDVSFESVSSLALCVLQLEEGRGALERAEALLRKVAPAPLVVLAAGIRVDAAVALVRLGVSDVVELPAAASDVAVRALRHVRGQPAAWDEGAIVGSSMALVEVRRQIRTAADFESTVLILGETGTGKGLVARAIHDASSRRSAPFVHVDCAALSPALVESEFFGHEKGAFTGASSLRHGRFELARRGTVFLDEIGDFDPSLQTKLLRVLQDRTFERVGGSQTLRMEARVIAATSRNLIRALEGGRFRADLYYRLNVFSIQIPPLRERRGDISELVRFGIEQLTRRLCVPAPRVSDGFYDRMLRHPWPGNAREVLNVLERCLVDRRVETLEADDLDGILDGGGRMPPAMDAGGDHDESAIRIALMDSGGNVSRAARRLGIQRGKLRYRIQKYGLRDLIPDD